MTESKDKAKNGNNKNAAFRRRFLVWAFPIAAVLLIAGFVYWRHIAGRVSTDDAFIEANVSPVSPRVAGTVSIVPIKDNRWVNEGDILTVLDKTDFRVKLAQAQAALELAESGVKEAESDIEINQKSTDIVKADIEADQAELGKVSGDLERYGALVRKDEVSRQQYDSVHASSVAVSAKVAADRKRLERAENEVQLARAKLGSSKAAVKRAQANIDEAKLNLGYTEVRAPVSGWVTNKSVQVGQYIQPGQPIMAIVEKDPWVVANFKEVQITHIRPGQKAHIEIDAYPGHDFYGHVDSIQAGSGAAFSLLPPENATGNYVKVTQRVPVKIIFDNLEQQNSKSKYVLGPGMSVVPTVFTK
jgi:membrane fusion protein (multidrug efflux system)